MLNTKAPVLGSLGMTLAREQGGCLSRRCIELSLAVYIIMERGEGNKTTKRSQNSPLLGAWKVYLAEEIERADALALHAMRSPVRQEGDIVPDVSH